MFLQMDEIRDTDFTTVQRYPMLVLHFIQSPGNTYPSAGKQFCQVVHLYFQARLTRRDYAMEKNEIHNAVLHASSHVGPQTVTQILNAVAQYIQVIQADDFIIADFEQGDTKVEGTYVALRNVDEKVRPSFIGLKPGDSLDVDVNAAFTNETDRASMLKVKKEELAGLQPVFRMTVKTVKTFKPAELNQDTFDRIFGEGVVTDAEEFDRKIAERLSAEYAQESEFRFSKDAREYLVRKADVALPEKFLKRWISVTNEGKFTPEDIEREFPAFLEDFRWQMVRGYLAGKYGVKVEEDDMFSAAKSFAAYQFAMYGLSNVPDQQLESYARSVLAQDKERGRIYEQVEEQKVLNAVRADVTLKNKKISVEKFRELK